MKKNNTKIKVHSVKYNFFMNFILTASGFIFPLITFPYVSRVLGPSPNGKIAFASAIINYFSLFAAMGIPTYGVRKIAEVRDNPEKLSKVVNELLIINVIFTLLSYAVLIIMVILIPKFRENALLIGVTSANIIFTTIGADWFYQGIEQYDYITIRNIIFKIIGIILMFVLVHKPADYVIYAGITIFANVGSNILNVIRLHQFVGIRIKSNYRYRVHLKPIFLLFLYNATTIIFTNLDQVMLGFMTSNKEVGYYAATVKIKNILTSVITALGAVMLPRVTYYLRKDNYIKYNKLITKSFNFIFMLAYPIMFYFLIEAKPAILFIAGKGYTEATNILISIIPSLIFIGLSSVTAWQILIPMKKEIWTVIGAVVGAVINLLLNFILIPKIGAMGAAIATNCAEFGVLATHCYVLKKNMHKWLNWIDAAKSAVAAVISWLILIGFNRLIVINHPFIECVITAMVYFGSYMMILVLFKEQLVQEGLAGFIVRWGKNDR